MNKPFKFSAAVLSLCCGAAACCSGCADRGRSTLLASPAERGAVTFEERRTEEFSDIRTGANAFAAKFSLYLLDNIQGKGNISGGAGADNH